LALAEAIRRGLEYNLGTVSFQNNVRQARAQRILELANLLPNLSGNLLLTEQQNNLAAFGFNFKLPVPGFSIPTVVGPFHYFDLRARVTQTVADVTRLRNYRATEHTLRATEFAGQDARDLVVLAVTGAYLSIISASARIDSARAQV